MCKNKALVLVTLMNLCFLWCRHEKIISSYDPALPNPKTFLNKKMGPPSVPVMLTFMFAVEWVDIP